MAVRTFLTKQAQKILTPSVAKQAQKSTKHSRYMANLQRIDKRLMREANKSVRERKIKDKKERLMLNIGLALHGTHSLLFTGILGYGAYRGVKRLTSKGKKKRKKR